MTEVVKFRTGSIVWARGREWILLPGSQPNKLNLRPINGTDEDKLSLLPHLEKEPVKLAEFPLPNPKNAGLFESGKLLRQAIMIKFRSGAGPFRSFGNIAFEPRAYQLVPLMMALKQPIVRLLIADDVGIGKTIEGMLIARELIDRGEILRFAVLCPPHLCDQWKTEIENHFHLPAEIVRTSTAGRLERSLPAGTSLFDQYYYTVVSLDFIKSARRKDEFLRSCPEFVIVDEAHTCTQSSFALRQQRYSLLKDLTKNRNRHMVLLTATPHSGDEEAFYNLLSLLNPNFAKLNEAVGERREKLRNELSRFFVQRRRPDIDEWKENKIFPDRMSSDAKYPLSGPLSDFFDSVLDHARTIIEKAEGKGAKEKQMNGWAAIALMRCVSSSPDAAVQALQNKLLNLENLTENEPFETIKESITAMVFDGEADDNLPQIDIEPGVLLNESAREFAVLIDQANRLRGPANDPKLEKAIEVLKSLVEKNCSTVVFCRYIATAHYVAEFIADSFPDYTVAAITGELASAEREDKIQELGLQEKRILVATDCLSEGVNLQEWFDAVVHYDLCWNPTRHEQREGRVDRFGQKEDTIHTVLLYSEQNLIDLAVLRIIIRKAEKIKKELGVPIPMPENSIKITEMVVESILKSRHRAFNEQISYIDKQEKEIGLSWESAKKSAQLTRTLFAQRRLQPKDVLVEWEKSNQAIGSTDEAFQFVQDACNRMQAPMERTNSGHMLPTEYLPNALKERLIIKGLPSNPVLTSRFPPKKGTYYINRSHPLVSSIAEYFVEKAITESEPELVSRCGAIFSDKIKFITNIFILRLRYNLVFARRKTNYPILTEEILTVALFEFDNPEFVIGETVRNLIETALPSKNMPTAARERFILRAKDKAKNLETEFDSLINQKAEELLEDHRRIRDASDAQGRYHVEPITPADIIGIFVLVPSGVD
jgi:superfamily II DNA or RNA helicase